MKLILEYIKKKALNYMCGSTLTNTKIRNLIALHFINSIRQKSITGNSKTNLLSYDTMFTVYLPEKIYKKIHKELIMIVKATTKELEHILKTKVNPDKFPNYNTPHSPYWQFLFQPVPLGSKIPDSDQTISDNSLLIESDTFPEGRDKNTKDQGNHVRVSIRSKRSTGMNETYFNKEAFVGVNSVSEGEYVVPFGKSLSNSEALVNRQSALLTLTISNAFFLVDGQKTNIYRMTTNEIFIAGKNANDTYNGVRVLRIADNHIMNPQIHICCQGGTIVIDANGNVRYRNKTIGRSSVNIVRGSSILINDTTQIEIS